MGQKVNPTGFRTGIMVGWKSRWYASKQEFSSLLMEDVKIRKFIKDKFRFAGIPKVEIERTRDEVKVVLHAARPGVTHATRPTTSVIPPQNQTMYATDCPLGGVDRKSFGGRAAPPARNGSTVRPVQPRRRDAGRPSSLTTLAPDGRGVRW